MSKLFRLMAAVVLLLGSGALAGPSVPAAAAGSTTVTVDTSQTIGTLPADFVGLSFETGALVGGDFRPTGSDEVNVMNALGVRNVRIGGNSVDRGIVPTTADITRLATFLTDINAQVEYAVGINPTNGPEVTSQTQQAMSIIGSHLDSIQCGNEPNDIFGSYAAFIVQFDPCKAAVGGRVPLSGPDTCCGATTWQQPFVTANSAAMDMVTNHYYNNSTNVTALLAPASDSAELSFPGVANALAAAKAHGLKYRSDETNSHNAGGVAGVSDVYAAALWAMDYSLLMASHGVDGLNFHGSFNASCAGPGYSPLCTGGGGAVTFSPMSYGLWMVSHLGAGPMHAVTVSGANNVTAYAITAADGTTRVAVIERDPTGGSVPLTISVSGGSVAGQAQVTQLSGPSLSGKTGITIQGASVDGSGNLNPGAPTQVPVSSGSLSLNLPTGSAIIVTMPGGGGCHGASGPPSAVTATPLGGGQAQVSWMPPTSGCTPATAYAVYDYSPSGAGITEVTQTMETLSNLPVDNHIFTVTAWNGSAWSQWSGWSSWISVT